MNVGDIEANFMSFIYSDLGDNTSPEESIVVKPEQGTSQSDEHKFRNTNLEKIESAKLSKGIESLGDEMKPMGFNDFSDFFNLEKVTK